MKEKTITAKQIVEKFGITYSTLNYYTAIGLLPLAGRQANERVYSEEEVRNRLKIISELVKEGYPLNLIRKKIAQ